MLDVEHINVNPEELDVMAANPPANVDNSELDEAIDTSLIALPLETAEEEIIAKIIDAPNKTELQEQFDAFNMNQSKKNALRIVKLNGLLSKVEDQAISRFEKRPDQVSNKELLEYMNVVSSQIDRAQRQVDLLRDTPAIQVNNQKNEVNINIGNQLDRDSKERVMDAISGLLKQITSNVSSESQTSESPIAVDGDFVEVDSEEDCSTSQEIIPMEETDDNNK